MPRVDALLDKIGGAQGLSTFDLTKGYWEIPLAKANRQKTAFANPSGLYQFTKMHFGLNGATASFQRVVDKVSRGVQDCTVAYVDDILVFTPSWEAHLTHLWRVLEVLRQIGLTANLKKTRLGQMSIQYLVFCIGQGRIWAVSDKVAAL